MLIRPAVRSDVPALVRLRLANAAHHMSLDLASYRLPSPSAVASYFAGALPTVQVAVLSSEVVGMVEVVPAPPPPSHQILRTDRSVAHVHTVVLPSARGSGVGAALLAAAVSSARSSGYELLLAGILAANDGAVRFYTAAGFTSNGLSLGLSL